MRWTRMAAEGTKIRAASGQSTGLVVRTTADRCEARAAAPGGGRRATGRVRQPAVPQQVKERRCRSPAAILNAARTPLAAQDSSPRRGEANASATAVVATVAAGPRTRAIARAVLAYRV